MFRRLDSLIETTYGLITRARDSYARDNIIRKYESKIARRKTLNENPAGRYKSIARVSFTDIGE